MTINSYFKTELVCWVSTSNVSFTQVSKHVYNMYDYFMISFSGDWWWSRQRWRLDKYLTMYDMTVCLLCSSLANPAHARDGATCSSWFAWCKWKIYVQSYETYTWTYNGMQQRIIIIKWCHEYISCWFNVTSVDTLKIVDTKQVKLILPTVYSYFAVSNTVHYCTPCCCMRMRVWMPSRREVHDLCHCIAH